ncbi:hypothetical protein TRVL_09945 [Trypanosoma vivax]|nr:hypothetical protein TRVL_09945 [Trypanosoma vivax]
MIKQSTQTALCVSGLHPTRSAHLVVFCPAPTIAGTATHVGASRDHAISSVRKTGCSTTATSKASKSRRHAHRTAQRDNANSRASHSTRAGKGARIHHGGACRCWSQSALSTKVACVPSAVLERKDVK